MPKTKSKKDVLGKIRKRKEPKAPEFAVTTVQTDEAVYIARYTLPNGHVETIDTENAKIDLEPMKEFIGEDFKLTSFETNLSRLCTLHDMTEVKGQLVMQFKEVN